MFDGVVRGGVISLLDVGEGVGGVCAGRFCSVAESAVET